MHITNKWQIIMVFWLLSVSQNICYMYTTTTADPDQPHAGFAVLEFASSRFYARSPKSIQGVPIQKMKNNFGLHSATALYNKTV